MDDLAVPQHHRSGAHRARRHPLLTVLASLAAVAVFSGVLLWALLSLDVLGAGERLESSLASPTAGAAATDAATPAGEDPAATDPTAAPEEPTAGTTGEPTEDGATAEAVPGAEPSPEPEVDRAVGVDVLNSTSTVGLAAGAAESLSELGWTVFEVANYGQAEIPTTVFYPSADLEATAEAVVEDLGVGAVAEDEDLAVVTVVLGPDYAG